MVKKSSTESLRKCIENSQKYNVGKPGSITYLFKKTAENTVVPAYNKVVRKLTRWNT